ncbi:MAG: hypothetical protein OIN84_20695 [Candidatus Methanoperedens sp.]|uniref:hypothetical protein n=1 Tax=Candidatus Methanoperedens sp. BLZ2 TaxID=2035255 RepID=UPI000BE3966D|nr:hypothetical protein [Candidatus Methanoperedens sp. BLZ2]KAB2942392.1 MAG: hypothetical protein F9K14_17230 [Candidatus Methanoperedens sp.]MBZ0176668.1 hypothetical protein [Candidatus Methanoperedens nitroreducens]MCX9080392.1 hypothetical protein [Candidatus Methanoperedens sp.]
MQENTQQSLAQAKNNCIYVGTNVLFEYGKHGVVRKSILKGTVEGLQGEYILIQGEDGGKYNRHKSQVRVAYV